MNNITINEIKGNLFESSDSLAHCVSHDFSMSKGIALTFNNLFGYKDELKSTNTKIGGVAILTLNTRYIYYLVTKENYWDKPTYNNLRLSIQTLFISCVQHNIKSLSIPKLGCGLDKLQWTQVKQIIVDEWPPIDNFILNVYYI